jgi:hypothetical protein
MKLIRYGLLFCGLATVFFSVLATPALAQPVPAANQTVEPTGGVVPGCDPSLPPNSPPMTNADGTPRTPCDVNAFAQLIKNVIRYLTYIVFPLAAVMIGWGGFQVMTAAGSAEKISKGWSSMRIAGIGLIFVLTSYMIVQFIFKVLGVTTDFSPGGI